MAGLARAFKRAGGKLYGKTEAKEIKGDKTAQIKTAKGRTITADAVVVATNTPVNDWVKMHTKQAAYRTYVIGVRVPLDSIPTALYWDTENPFHYVRLQRIGEGAQAKDILIIGGEDHKTGQNEGLENRYLYREEQARSVHVASNAILEALKKVYNADWLLREILAGSS